MASTTNEVTVDAWSDSAAYTTNALVWKPDNKAAVFVYYGSSAPTDGDFSDALPLDAFVSEYRGIVVLPAGTDNWYIASKIATKARIATEVTF